MNPDKVNTQFTPRDSSKNNCRSAEDLLSRARKINQKHPEEIAAPEIIKFNTRIENVSIVLDNSETITINLMEENEEESNVIDITNNIIDQTFENLKPKNVTLKTPSEIKEDTSNTNDKKLKSFYVLRNGVYFHCRDYFKTYLKQYSLYSTNIKKSNEVMKKRENLVHDMSIAYCDLITEEGAQAKFLYIVKNYNPIALFSNKKQIYVNPIVKKIPTKDTPPDQQHSELTTLEKNIGMIGKKICLKYFP